jgi:hypothetical protein
MAGIILCEADREIERENKKASLRMQAGMIYVICLAGELDLGRVMQA